MYDIISRDDIDDIHETAAKCKTRYFWYVDHGVDCTGFDFNWVPVPWESQFVHIFPSKWQRDGGIRLVNKQSPEGELKFHNTKKVTRVPTTRNWILDDSTDYSNFDFSWHPDSLDGEFIYVFPSQWQRDGGTYYVTSPDAPRKYVNDQATIRVNSTNILVDSDVILVSDDVPVSSDKENWTLSRNVDESTFDFSWHPSPTDSPYIYKFGTQWQKDGGAVYKVEGATKTKYLDVPRAKALPTTEHWHTDTRVVSADNVKHTSDIKYGWKLQEDTDYSNFDLSWHPDPAEKPYTYVFPSQWQRDSGTHYITEPGAPKKYVSDQVIRPLPNKEDWIIPKNIDEDSFDFSWLPDPDDPPYIYVFGTQWQKDGGPVYKVEGATETSYIDTPQAKALPTTEHWHTDSEADYSTFDFSWHPEESQKDFKHVFGSQWQKTSKTFYYNGNDANPKVNYVTDQRVTSKSDTLPRYNIETTLENLINEHPTERFWALNPEMDYKEFDFSWHPDASQMEYVHVFGSQWQKHSQTFYVNAPAYLKGNNHLNFVGDQKVVANSTLDIFYIDKGGEGSTERYDSLVTKHSQTLKTRFFGNTRDTLLRCAKKCKTGRFWAVSSENDYSNFNFDWHCEPWQNGMLHVFGSKWNKWSNTFLVNADDFIRTFDWAENIEDVYNLNFVEDQLVTTLDDLNDVVFLDFGNSDANNAYKTVYSKHPKVKRIRFFDNYLDTFKRIIQRVDTDYFWITSSICDYTDFDFSWQPEPWQDKMLHTFQSGEQKFGDTFYVNKAHAEEQLPNIKLLDWYDKVNFCDEQTVKRTEWPEVIYDSDLVTAIKEHTFESPYVAFKHRSMAEYKTNYDPNVWRQEDRSLHVLTQSGSVSVVPKDCKAVISRQVYDYPHILRHEALYLQDKPQDIVFISYDEKNADKNYEVLLNRFPYAKRIHGVEGNLNAYKAAAEISETPYYYAVFAKTVIHDDFMFNHQPDWLSNPKHYIFYAYNPVLDYSYGHGGVKMYDVEWIKQVKPEDIKLDVTLSHDVEVIPEISCINVFASPWDAWRTAFREAYKLAGDESVESRYRLKLWTTKENTDMGSHSKAGALSAVEHYNNTKDDKRINDWNWLKEQFRKQYP